MPSRLKSLELTGYKTFASKTKFEFSGNVNVIVGPNGSGKSNIADALRWVLGEQSYSLLRGRRTDDMIFAGSQTRARAGMAAVTVTFDNTDGWLPIDFTEVSVTRRAYRDGRNDYMINGKRVRLLDVSELLSKSGLAERTYTIIGQGLVDAALSLKAEERRRLFEEAAGIGLYRKRKQQSLRRLDATQRNLERIQDILAELAPRQKSLERQARRADEYESLRSDLQITLRQWYGFHWHRAQKTMLEARSMAHRQDGQLLKSRDAHEKHDQLLSERRSKINGLRARLGSWHRDLSQLHGRREENSRELAVSDERERSYRESQDRLGEEIQTLEAQYSIEQDRLARATSRAERLQGEVEEAQAQLSTVRTAFQSRQERRADLDKTIEANRQLILDLSSREAEQNARRAELESRVAQFEVEKAGVEEAIGKAQQQMEDAQLALTNAEKFWQAAKTTRDEIEAAQAEGHAAREAAEAQSKDLSSQRAQKQAEHARFSAQLDVLVQAENQLTGYASGARVLLEAAREGRLPGSQGALSGQLSVPAEYEKAIAAALGDFVDAILLDAGETADQALALLDGEDARAALLPLNALVPPDPLTVPSDADCLGLAAELVEAPAVFSPVVDLVLGQTLVVRDRAAARRLLTSQPEDARAVTLAGEIFSGRGAILVSRDESGGALGRVRQRQELEASLLETDTALETLQTQIDAHQTTVQTLSDNETRHVADLKTAGEKEQSSRAVHQQALLDQQDASRQLVWHLAQRDTRTEEHQGILDRLDRLAMGGKQLVTEISETEHELRARTIELAGLTVDEQQNDVNHWETQLALSQQSIGDAQAVQTERQEICRQTKTALTASRQKLTSVDENISGLRDNVLNMRSSEGGLGEKITRLQVLIEPAEAELTEAEAGLEELETQEAETRQALSTADRHNTQSQMSQTRAQEELDRLKQRIEDDFGLVEFEFEHEISGQAPLPLGEQMVLRLPIVDDLDPAIEGDLKRIRAQIRRMGAINPEAQREYAEVKERFEFMTEQVEDLQQAEIDVRQIIAELDVMMERDFRHTYEKVAAEFKDVFPRLFNGGSARLILTEADNVNEKGVDIEARLPGKRAQRLAMLSGGERALTATALVFALIKAAPTPFCVMDEIDAALDESNIGRLREVLLELSKDTQFVVITHNRNTVQSADVIYGITLGRDSTSQSISLRMEDVDSRYAED